jgi:hypothetical protein
MLAIVILVDAAGIGKVERELAAIKRGIDSVIPIDILKPYFADSVDLQFLVGGSNNGIDLNDWRSNTGLLSSLTTLVYKGYRANDAIITWFWEVLPILMFT